MISLSGFKSTPEKNDKSEASRERCAAIIRALGATVHDGDFEEGITHVVCPGESVTFKSLGAAVTSKWEMDAEWLLASERAGYFVDERPYGQRNDGSPFQNKRYYLAPSFHEGDHAETAKTLIQTVRLPPPPPSLLGMTVL